MHIIFRLGQLIFPKFAWILYMDMTNLIFKVTLENEAAKFKPKYLNAHFAVGQPILPKLAWF